MICGEENEGYMIDFLLITAFGCFIVIIGSLYNILVGSIIHKLFDYWRNRIDE